MDQHDEADYTARSIPGTVALFALAAVIGRGVTCTGRAFPFNRSVLKPWFQHGNVRITLVIVI
jgi:hypothetical protein